MVPETFQNKPKMGRESPLSWPNREEIHGDGVNITVRLEGLAPPGGVCISGMVYENVRDRIDLPFKDLSEK